MKAYSIIATFLVVTNMALGQQTQLMKQVSKIFEENKYKEVITLAERYNNFISGEDAKEMNDLEGRSYYALHMYDSCVYFENKALALDNDATWVSAWAYTYRGMAQYRLGKKEEGIADLQKAISMDKTHNSTESAKEFLGDIYSNSVTDDSCAFLFSQGAYKSTITEGRKQLQKKDYRRVLELVGASYFNIHYYDSAIYFEQRALAIDKDSTAVSGWAHVYLGMALYNRNEKENAIAELRKAIVLDKTSNSVRKAENFLDNIINGRALVIDSLHQVIKDQLNSNNYRGAANNLLTILANNPEDALTWDQLTTAYCWLHNYDSSIFCGQKAIALDKGQSLISCEPHYHIGIDRFMKSDRKGADQEFTAALNDRASENLKKKVKRVRLYTGLDDTYDRWKTVESENIIFHFQSKKSIDNIDEFTAKYEKEYTNASKTLPVTLPKKIDLFVWEQESQARNTLQGDKEGPYSNYDFCVIHITLDKNPNAGFIRMMGFWAKK